MEHLASQLLFYPRGWGGQVQVLGQPDGGGNLLGEYLFPKEDRASGRGGSGLVPLFLYGV